MSAKLTIKTSNKQKIAEYWSFGLENIQVEPGPDLKEVDGTPLEVIAYKALAAGDGNVVEDSIMIVDGQPFVDIRWRVATVSEWFGKNVSWEVRLGVNRDGAIEVYKGAVDGIMRPAAGKGFDYDPFFHIPSENMSLAQLKNLGRKDEFSARKMAVESLLSNTPEAVFNIQDILPWQGDYQHDDEPNGNMAIK